MRKILVVLGLLLITQFGFGAAFAFICGDANGDGGCNLGDAIRIINYVFYVGPVPNPLEAGDPNADGSVNIADAAYIYAYVFDSGPAPGSTEACDISPYSWPVPDPGTADTVTIESKFLPPGTTEFTVDVYLYNDEELAAFDIPLAWDSPDIQLESISWTGSAVESWASKSYQIDAGNRKFHVGALAIFDTRISPGSYLLFSAAFSVDPVAPDQVINIDSAFYVPALELYLTLSNSFIVQPQFVPGEISLGVSYDIIVTNTNDTGVGSFRWAIDSANIDPAANNILFDVSGTIQLATPLPAIADSWTKVLGSTAPSGAHSIILDGTGMGAEMGLVVNSDYNIISGLTVINWEDHGIEITGNRNVVENCHINVNAAGDTRQAGGGHGINISGDYNMVGGPDEMNRNIIACSDNKNGINISLGNFNDVMGNYIGLSASGGALNDLPAGFTYGIRLLNANNNNVGEITALGNYIAGVSSGIEIFNGLENQIANNYLGLATNLVDTIPNNTGIVFNGTSKYNTIGPDNVIAKCGSNGIYIPIGCDSNTVRGNTLIGGAGSGIMLTSGPIHNQIGGSNPEDGNIICFNAQNGITIYGGTSNNFIRGNTIYANTMSGINIEFNCDSNVIEQNRIYENDRDGIAVSINSLYNSISENQIYLNGEIGIDLNLDGVTLNDSGDVDTGPNDLLNFPVIDSAFSQEDGTYDIYGVSTALATIEIFVAHPAGDATRPEDATGYGEAYSYVGNTVAEPSGDFLVQDIAVDHFSVITSTATDILGNTSEFSANFMLIPAPLIVVAYSPVNIIIEDPNGFRFGKDADGNLIDEISPAEYNDLPNDSVIIGQPILGEYIISFVTESGADPNSTYSAIIKVNGTLAVMIVIGAQVPDAGVASNYNYTVGEEGYYANGDSNGDESINLADASFIINYIFYEGPAPYPLLSGDANCDMGVNLGDAGYVINYIFYDGPAPCYFAP